MKVSLIGTDNKERFEERMRIVGTAAGISETKSDAHTTYNEVEDLEKTSKLISRIINLGHESIIDHDYLVFLIDDVSQIVEKALIDQRYSSFTIKSRRYVDFRDTGYYVPDFKDETGKILDNNEELQEKYITHCNKLYDVYEKLVAEDIPKEDARFVLPRGLNNSIIMGIDAHALRELVTRFTKKDEKNITELNDFAKILEELIDKEVPYLKNKLSKIKEKDNYKIEKMLDETLKLDRNKNYDNKKEVALINSNKEDADTCIFASLIAKTYDIPYSEAYNLAKYNLNLESAKKIMQEIYLDTDNQDVLQNVNFTFNIPISFATLPHIMRHRTIKLTTPNEYDSNGINASIVIPPTIKENEKLCNLYQETFEEGRKLNEELKSSGARKEDLIYLSQCGNNINTIISLDGKALKHFAGLRMCNRAQWEVRNIANLMQEQVKKEAPIYSTILGPTCMINRTCNEGRKSCGKLKMLIKEESEKGENNNG